LGRATGPSPNNIGEKAMKDIYNNLALVQAVKPVLVLDNVVPAAVEVDLAGFNSALIELNVGLKNADTGTITLTLTHADDDGTGVSGDYSNVAAADVLGVTPVAGLIKTIDVDADADTSHVFKYGYVGGKRFIKLTLAELNDNATGVILAITVIKGHPLDAPVA
jgi:hypothetical protein